MNGFNRGGFNKMPFNRGFLVRILLFAGRTLRSVATAFDYLGQTRRIVQRITRFFGIKDTNFSIVKDTNFSIVKDTNFSRKIKGSH